MRKLKRIDTTKPKKGSKRVFKDSADKKNQESLEGKKTPFQNALRDAESSGKKTFKFKDKDGNVITDPEMNTLAVKFFESINDKNRELIRKYANEAKEKLGDDNVMDTVVKLFDYKAAVEKGSDGEKSEFHHDFVRQMCSQTIKE